MVHWKWLGGTGFAVAFALAAIWVAYGSWIWVAPPAALHAELPAPKPLYDGAACARAVGAVDRNSCIAEFEAQRLAQRDLVQQTRAADAATISGQMAVVQTRLSVISAIGGLLTLIAAGLAAYYARRAAIEAARQVDLAHKSLVATERGRMIIDQIKLGDLGRPLDEADNGATEYLRRYVNIGNGVAWIRSEATQLIIAGIDEVFEPELPDPEEMNWPVKGGDWWGTMAMEKGRGLPISPESRQQVANGTRLMFAFYALTYTSGGPTIYKSNCVYKYRPSDGTMVPYPHPFWFHD